MKVETRVPSEIGHPVCFLCNEKWFLAEPETQLVVGCGCPWEPDQQGKDTQIGRSKPGCPRFIRSPLACIAWLGLACWVGLSYGLTFHEPGLVVISCKTWETVQQDKQEIVGQTR
ncbi:hypothetical protein SAY87_004959 [Trapa incisa]|uniref:Uncharacterized protein n=1 Tax=Trapa incisa TaxID=236973 RepID=A0AAN7JQH8_9MYRT|nr:hypothetical protein SAY87_004959 [Trapa incisa]